MGSKKYARDKGLDFEREIAKELRKVFPRARRKLESVPGTALGVDLEETGKLKIQCKRTKKYVSINTISEIKDEGIPVLITKANNQPAMAVIPFDWFLKILEDIGEVYDD